MLGLEKAMFHKGLDRERIVSEATLVIEEVGLSGFSMRLLAERLGVKAASLYTHVESMNALLSAVGLSVLHRQRDTLIAAIEGRERDEALLSLADAYMSFAREHRELYKMIMSIPSSDDDILKAAAAMTAEPFMRALAAYALSNEERMHWQRGFRALLHGFVSEEQSGYFSHYPINISESLSKVLCVMIKGLSENER